MSRNYLPDSIYTICGEFTQDCNNCYNQKWSPIVNGIVHDSQRGKVFCPFGSGNSMNTPIFGEQIKYFNNANLIICAHGACMANMFFCKEGTTIIEVTCGKHWPFFDKLSNILNLNHIKCHENNFDSIIKYIRTNIDLLEVS